MKKKREIVPNPNVQFVYIKDPKRPRLTTGERLLVLMIGVLAGRAITIGLAALLHRT